MQLNKTTSNVLSVVLEKQFWNITEYIKPKAPVWIIPNRHMPHLPPHKGSYPSEQPGFLHRTLKSSCPSRQRGGHTSSASQEQWAAFSWITVASSPLPSHLARWATPFRETGSCDKQDQHFQPINGQKTAVSHCQSHFL